MTEKERIKFDNSLLIKCLNDNNSELLGSYPKLTRNIKINFKCGKLINGRKCNTETNKVFRQIYETGAICDDCILKQKKEKREKTCIEIYGETHPSKSNIIIEKQNTKRFKKNHI